MVDPVSVDVVAALSVADRLAGGESLMVRSVVPRCGVGGLDGGLERLAGLVASLPVRFDAQVGVVAAAVVQGVVDVVAADGGLE